MRYSKQRNLILDIVKSTTVHPTAEWVYEEARRAIPSIGIATVYRNLRYLVDAGEIKRISTAEGIERYDGNTNRHYHLKCRECGRLFDLEAAHSEAVGEMEKKVMDSFKLDAGYITVNTTLLEGICEDCLARDEMTGTNIEQQSKG